MKIGFYIDNSNLKKIDMSKLEYGNPGIGGSEYMILCLVLGLSQNIKYKLHLFSNNKISLKNVKNIVLNKYENIFDISAKMKIDILVFKYVPNLFFLNQKNQKNNIPFIIWAHNIIPNFHLSLLNKNPNLKSLVCVGKEQQDLFRDNSIFYKSTYIFNSIFKSGLEQNLPSYNERKNEVTYIGSLVPEKGFHILAKAWPKVIKIVPDAKLNVIGSGKLYNANSKLGDYGIADKNYEKMFMPFLTDNNGKILDSVKFWGIMGDEKIEILKKTKVGIPNPSGLTETFCISAVEMQLAGCKVISKKYVGLIDTVLFPGILISNTSKYLHKEIIKALKSNQNFDTSLVQKKLVKKFSVENNLKNWTNLFDKIFSGNEIKIEIKTKNYLYNLKWLREINRLIKKTLPFGKFLPEIDQYLSLAEKIFNKNFIKY